MLDDALSLSLSLTLYIYLPISLSLSLSLSEIYAQPPVDGYLSNLHYHTRWYSFSYFIIYICIYDYPYNATWRGKQVLINSHR